ncbi:MAG: hypothetical protein ABIL44_06655 [candidate division WOR-3 bacterium]
MLQDDNLMFLLGAVESAIEKLKYHVIYSFHGVNVLFQSNNVAFLKFMDAYFINYFHKVINSQPQVHIYACLNSMLLKNTEKVHRNISESMPSNYHFKLIYNCDSTHPIYWFINMEKRIIIIFLSKCSDIEKYAVMRTVRALVKLLLINQGMLLFHAACAVKKGYSICFIGEKHSGKTTTLINALVNCNCSYLSNDEVIIGYYGDRIYSYGLPISIGLRFGTIRQFHFLSYLCSKEQTAYNGIPCKSNKVFYDDDTRIYVTPQNLVSVLRSSITTVAKVGYFVVPILINGIDEAKLIPLSQNETANYLLKHWLSVPFPEQPFLNIYTCSNNREVRKTINQIAIEIPAYKLIQSERSNTKAALLLNKLFSMISDKGRTSPD